MEILKTPRTMVLISARFLDSLKTCRASFEAPLRQSRYYFNLPKTSEPDIDRVFLVLCNPLIAYMLRERYESSGWLVSTKRMSSRLHVVVVSRRDMGLSLTDRRNVGNLHADG
eukprot:8578243-Pyramimonas_sp.AAC.1